MLPSQLKCKVDHSSFFPCNSTQIHLSLAVMTSESDVVIYQQVNWESETRSIRGWILKLWAFFIKTATRLGALRWVRHNLVTSIHSMRNIENKISSWLEWLHILGQGENRLRFDCPRFASSLTRLYRDNSGLLNITASVGWSIVPDLLIFTSKQ